MKRLPISVFIITKNEEDRLPKAIKSVREWVDEVIVVDSCSDDNTQKIAKELGATIIEKPFAGYGLQKIFAQDSCKNDWVLNIDADEEITDELRQSIEAVFADNTPAFNAYQFHIVRPRMFSDKPPGRFASRHIQTRLYHRAHAGFKDSDVHDSVITFKEEPLGNLKGIANHHTFRNYHHAIEKMNFYSSMQAKDMVEKGRVPSLARILCEPFIAFFKGYVLKKHIFNGTEGLFEALLYMFARIIRLIKAREYAHALEQEKKKSSKK